MSSPKAAPGKSAPIEEPGPAVPGIALDLLPEPEVCVARESPIEPETRGNPGETARSRGWRRRLRVE
jgi:hypothetical protein